VDTKKQLDELTAFKIQPMRVDRTGNKDAFGEIGWFDWFRGG
jgi:hypothetical protein